ncbi:MULTISPECIES: hypothetical protein [Dysgonomonas]|uniref:hypothetical protein n=1 Tax=Dysgonomonas TaxID=156973 RepID=UPI0018841A60|nr:hypothetical protein [Dysgonomonas sp. GY75]MBF0647739.1 hypothetical protein [Dysgonomonas sp. GY75]
MKKFLYFIFICTLCVGFTACGGDDDDPKEEEFVWNGNWNDPNDKNYKPEGYNPIQGVWQRDDDPSIGMYLSKDFKDYYVTFYSNGEYKIESVFKDNYQINNTAFRYSPNEVYKWEIENNKLYTLPVGTYKEWVSYTKIDD